MPVVDRREFGGRFTVKENSQRLANYRYLEIQLMEMIGGLVATPRPSSPSRPRLATTSTTMPRPPTCWASAWSSCARTRDAGAGARTSLRSCARRLETRRHGRPAGRRVPGARAAPGEHLCLPRRRDRPAGRYADRASAAPAGSHGPVARCLGPGGAGRSDALRPRNGGARWRCRPRSRRGWSNAAA